MSPSSGEHRIPSAWRWLEGWLLLCTGCSLLGWLLAFTGSLTPSAYLCATALGLAALARYHWPHRPYQTYSPLRRRHWLPRTFALLFTLSLLGALLHAPSNYDALTYRLPQILHWLAAHHWHWIPATDLHLNITPPGQGWLIAPLLALTHSDRLAFLPSLVSFALLPGLYFSVLRGCGVRQRTAWTWMWLLPLGSCFAMQAGSLANDLLATTYWLAAFAFAFRARHSQQFSDIAFSLLAVALATGVKVTVLPLTFPWLCIVWPSRQLLVVRPASTAAILSLAAAISFLPTALLNLQHSGHWSGDPTNQLNLRAVHPTRAVIANSLQIAAAATAPAVCPVASSANHLFEHLDATPFHSWLTDGYPRFRLWWGELASEEESGLGLGLTLLAFSTLLCGFLTRYGKSPSGSGRAVALASGIAFLSFLAVTGSEAAPRLASTYYPFLLIPVLRLPGAGSVLRRPWWHALVAFAVVSIVGALILTPSRPLWPARSILASLSAHRPDSHLLQRTALVYDAYAQRADLIAPLRPAIPATARVIAYVPTQNDIEAPLWKPYGTHAVRELMRPTRDDPAVIAAQGSVVLTSERAIRARFHLTLADFATAIGGHISASAQITQKAKLGPELWVAIALP